MLLFSKQHLKLWILTLIQCQDKQKKPAFLLYQGRYNALSSIMPYSDLKSLLKESSGNIRDEDGVFWERV